MENKDKAAFPLGDRKGLTKREYFAGLAMQGLLANNDGFYVDETEKTTTGFENKAKFCVLMADELLKQLEQ